MTTIYHLDPQHVVLSDALKTIAQGIHDHLYGHGREDIANPATLLKHNVDCAYLALSVLATVAPLTFDWETQPYDDHVHIDLTTYERSYKFLWECGFSDEVIAKCGLSLVCPYGSL